MNGELLLDAIGSMDEELLSDTDRVRRCPKRRPIPWIRIGSIAAVITMLLVGSVAAIRYSGMFSYKAADMSAENEAADIMCGSTDDEMREDALVNGKEAPEDAEGSSGTVGNQPFRVSSWESGRLLAEATDDSSSFSEQYPQVYIVGDGITENEYPVGSYIMVYYSRIDTTTDPATVYAVSVEMLHNVFEP